MFRFFIGICFLGLLAQALFAQGQINIELTVDSMRGSLPETAIPYINVEFVEKKSLRIRKTPKFHSKTPRYGKIVLGNSPRFQSIPLVIDEPAKGNRRIFIDQNNNGDLTDDGDPGWEDVGSGVFSKAVVIDAVFIDNRSETRLKLPFIVSRYENPDTKYVRIAFRPENMRRGLLTIGNETFTVLAQTYNKNGLYSDPKEITLAIDRNKDGEIDQSVLSAEIFWGGSGGGKPFNIKGESYLISKSSAAGNSISLAVSPVKVAPKNYVLIGESAPHFSFTSLDSTFIDSSKLQSKATLLDFWATWCIPCISNLPELAALKNSFSKEDLTIVGVSVDGGENGPVSTSFIETFINTHKIDWQIVFDDSGFESVLAKQFNVTDLPLYIVIDEHGVIRLIERGGGTERMERIKQVIDRIVNQKSE